MLPLYAPGTSELASGCKTAAAQRASAGGLITTFYRAQRLDEPTQKDLLLFLYIL
jgi:hypothetical protein